MSVFNTGIIPGLSVQSGSIPPGMSFGQQPPLTLPSSAPTQYASPQAPAAGSPPQSQEPYPSSLPSQGPSPDYFNDPRLNQAQSAFNSLQSQAVQSQSQEYTLPAMLREALAKKFADNPLVQTREQQTQNLLNTLDTQNSSMLPENNNGVIFTPQQQADLLAKRRNAATAPLATTNYLLGLQTGGIQNVIDAAAGAQKAQTESLTGAADIAKENYQNILTQLSKEADIALKQQELRAQYGDPQSLQAITDLFQGTKTAINQGEKIPQGDISSLDNLRSAAQQMYSSTTNPKLQSLIENQWMAKSGGKPLFPKPLSPQETENVANTTQVLQQINQAIALLKTTETGGIGGNIQALMLTHPSLYGLASPDLRSLNDIFIRLSSAGERGLIGGRLQSQLLSMTKTAFPSISKGNSDNLRELQQLAGSARNDLETLADTNGLLSVDQIPNIENSYLHVKNNTTGEAGYLTDSNEFDPKKYSLIQ